MPFISPVRKPFVPPILRPTPNTSTATTAVTSTMSPTNAPSQATVDSSSPVHPLPSQSRAIVGSQAGIARAGYAVLPSKANADAADDEQTCGQSSSFLQRGYTPSGLIAGGLLKPSLSASSAPLLAPASRLPTTTATPTSTTARYWSVLYTARSTKKHKSYQDGVLVVEKSKATLYNESARPVTSTFASGTAEWQIDDEVIVGGQQVQLVREHPPEDFTSGAIFPAACSVPAALPSSAPPRPVLASARAGVAPLARVGQVRGPLLAAGTAQPFSRGAPAHTTHSASTSSTSAASAPVAASTPPTRTASTLTRRPGVLGASTASAAPTACATPSAPVTTVVPYDPSNLTHLPPPRAGLSAIQLPHFLSSVLRPHQLQGARFLVAAALGAHGGAILADDMGLGKSLQAVTAAYALMVLAKVCRKLLLVCPASLCAHWRSEWAAWVGEHRLSLRTGSTAAEVSAWLWSAQTSVLICSYEAYRDAVAPMLQRISQGQSAVGAREALKLEKQRKREKEQERAAAKKDRLKRKAKALRSGKGWNEEDEEEEEAEDMDEGDVKSGMCLERTLPPLGLICDEAHRLKGGDSNKPNKTIQAISSVPFRFRVLLTGTPIQNNLDEFFTLVSLAAPSLLPDKAAFSSLYRNPIAKSVDASASAAEKALGSARANQLAHLTQRVLLRRGREVLRGWVPPRRVVCVVVEECAEMRLARNAIDRVRKSGQGAQDSLQAVGLLRKCALHPMLCLGAKRLKLRGAGTGAGADIEGEAEEKSSFTQGVPMRGFITAAAHVTARDPARSGTGVGVGVSVGAVSQLDELTARLYYGDQSAGTGAGSGSSAATTVAKAAKKRKRGEEEEAGEDVEVEDEEDGNSAFTNALLAQLGRRVPYVQDSPKMSVLLGMLARVLLDNTRKPLVEQTKVVLVSSYTSVLDLVATAISEMYRATSAVRGVHAKHATHALAECGGGRGGAGSTGCEHGSAHEHGLFQPLKLDGRVESKQREEIVKAFQKDSHKNDNNWVLLLSAGAGGVGLNLTRASVMVLLDCHWNGAVDQQAMGRIWRAGQTRECVVYRLLTANSVDEVAMLRQIKKGNVAGAALSKSARDHAKSRTELREDDVKQIFSIGNARSHVHKALEQGDRKGRSCSNASLARASSRGDAPVGRDEEDATAPQTSAGAASRGVGGFEWRWSNPSEPGCFGDPLLDWAGAEMLPGVKTLQERAGSDPGGCGATAGPIEGPSNGNGIVCTFTLWEGIEDEATEATVVPGDIELPMAGDEDAGAYSDAEAVEGPVPTRGVTRDTTVNGQYVAPRGLKRSRAQRRTVFDSSSSEDEASDDSASGCTGSNDDEAQGDTWSASDDDDD